MVTNNYQNNKFSLMLSAGADYLRMKEGKIYFVIIGWPGSGRQTGRSGICHLF